MKIKAEFERTPINPLISHSPTKIYIGNCDIIATFDRRVNDRTV